MVRTASRSKDPRCSISKLGRISFNKAMSEKLQELNIERVRLFFEPNLRLIGIQPSDKDNHSSVKVSFSKRHGTAAISARSLFVEYEGRLPERAATYQVVWSEEDQMFIISLNNPIS